MIAGMYRMSGCDVFASQLKMLVLSTPICSATSFWSIFNPSRRFRMWSPIVCGSSRNPDHRAGAVRLRQHQRHRLIGLAEAVGDGGLGLLDAALFDGVHPDASHQDLDQAPLQLPRDRLVEPFPELRQERLRGADVRADRVRARDPAAQFGDLRLQRRLLLADLVHLRVQVGIGQSAAPVQAHDPAALRRLLREQSLQAASPVSWIWSEPFASDSSRA